MARPQMRGPGGRRGMMGGKRSKNPKKTLGRLMKYIQKGYGVQFVVVLICILLSAVANVAGSMFLKSLIDDYISPLLLQASPVFTGLLHALMSMAVIYLIGIATTFIYNWLMVGISQGVLKKVRDEMFAHMQKLPIRYFDTHTHGDLMSHFTNDIDTISDALNNSFAMIIQSFIQIVGTLILLFILNWQLSLVVVLGYGAMFAYIRYSGKKSKLYFNDQQHFLGDLNGYIEEMVAGQKVIKVFNLPREKSPSKVRRNKRTVLLCNDDSHGGEYILCKLCHRRHPGRDDGRQGLHGYRKPCQLPDFCPASSHAHQSVYSTV